MINRGLPSRALTKPKQQVAVLHDGAIALIEPQVYTEFGLSNGDGSAQVGG
jgi:hypothetical protein